MHVPNHTIFIREVYKTTESLPNLTLAKTIPCRSRPDPLGVRMISPIPIISNSSSIVAVTSEVGNGVVRNFFVFIDEHLKLTDADTKVRLVKTIRNVPTEWTKFTTFLNQCVKETETKQKLLPRLRGRKGEREREG